MDNSTLISSTTLEELIQQINYSSDYLALSWSVKVSGMLSVLSCLWVIYDQMIIRKNQPKNTGSYVLVIMSACDVLSSFVFYVLGSSLAPTGLAWDAFGNTATCTIQGYTTVVFGSASVAYNAMLALYFLLVVRHRWGPSRFQTVCCRFWFFLFPLVWSTLLATLIALNGAFNFEFGVVSCYIASFPIGCDEYEDIVGKCTSGEMALLFLLVNSVAILLTSVIIIVSMVLLYKYIKTSQQLTARFTTNNTAAELRTLQTAKVGILYSGAFVVSWFWYVFIVIYAMVKQQSPDQWMTILCQVMLSLQGFFNAMIYTYRQHLNNRAT